MRRRRRRRRAGRSAASRRAHTALAALALGAGLAACAPDLDDSGRGGPPVDPVSFISSADGPLWLGAPPTASRISEDALNEAARSVVPVRASGCGPVSNGTAFAVAPGLLVAAAHAVAGATAIEIDWPVGTSAASRTHRAEAVGFDETRDLALLRTDARVPPLEIGRARLGAVAAVLGRPEAAVPEASPARIEHYVSAGGLWGARTRRNVYVLAADIRAGQSGAPLVDRRGRAVGIAFAAVRGPADIGFALSRTELLGFLVSSGIDARIDYLDRTVIREPAQRLPAVPSGTC